MTRHINPDSRSTIEQKFWEFHEAHPEVYAELVGIARGLIRRGYKRFGIATCYEVCRWRSMMGVGVGRTEPFKLNNNYRAYYARLIMQREPDLRGIFKTRELGVPSHMI